jgi:hypothetical protein
MSRFFALAFGWVTFACLHLATACAQTNYAWIGTPVQKTNATTNEVLGTGLMLLEPVLTTQEVKKVEIRYAPDTTAINQGGNTVQVQRIMDFYYPDQQLTFTAAGEPITKLPVVVILHAGNGNRFTAANQAIDMAVRGYCVLVPTYRSDRSVANYCQGFEKTVYNGVQDIRAAIRMLTKFYEVRVNDGPQAIESQLGSNAVPAANEVASSRCDVQTLFLSGFSNGGSNAFHLATRVLQSHWADYYNSTEPYVVTGELGPANFGQNGSLDATGIPFIAGYPMPIQHLRGSISRTAGVGMLEHINYATHPNPVPVCFIHGTCDRIIPYQSGSLVGSDELCDARITFPGGEQDSIVNLFGSMPIAFEMAQQGGYAELYTFCGGGHVSNQCITALLNVEVCQFMQRILQGNTTPGQVLEKVYRYHTNNYSNQCCDIGEAYTYLEKCSCGDENPFTVTDLPYTTMNACQFTNPCGIVDYCALEPTAVFNPNAQLAFGKPAVVFSDGSPALSFFVSASAAITLEVYDHRGVRLHSEVVRATAGINTWPLPAELPVRSLLIGGSPQTGYTKWVLQP